jgi:RNase P/RNase MRP subunit p30
MAILNTLNVQDLRNQIQKIKKQDKEEPIIVKAGDEEFNRKVLEIKEVNILLSPELHDKKDKMKQRDSGLNEFLCKLAKKNNIKIGINIQEIQSLPTIQKAKVLARIIQNIMLCKKAKADIILWPKNKCNKLDTIAFLTTLKASTQQASSSLSN